MDWIPTDQEQSSRFMAENGWTEERLQGQKWEGGDSNVGGPQWGVAHLKQS